MNILLGKSVSTDIINRWIGEVNAEFDLSDKNALSSIYFENIKDDCIFVLQPEWYAVLMPSVDMWGRREMCVISYYIKKESRNIRLFLTIQRKFEELAKAFDCQFIVQGSHLGDRLFKYLERNGYEVAEMRKEL